MKLQLEIVKRLTEMTARAIHDFRGLNVEEKHLLCYLPGFFIEALEASIKPIKYEKIRNMVRPGLTIFGVEVLPGYEQNKIIVANTKAEVYPQCVRRIEIDFEIDSKGTIIPFDLIHKYHKLIIKTAPEPFWRKNLKEVEFYKEEQIAQTHMREYMQLPSDNEN